MNQETRFPAEWETQEAIQLTWPHSKDIWDKDYQKVNSLFVSISKTMISHVRLIIVCLEPKLVSKNFSDTEKKEVVFIESNSNDIWSRDHAFLTTYLNKNIILYNFIFNGWGMKFPANHDNQININIWNQRIFRDDIQMKNIPFVLEGGSIDSNGNGEAITTSSCIFSKNRNDYVSKKDIVTTIKQNLGIKKLHILNSGFLKGDDTDSHIDMLARFVSKDTIVYATCDKNDEHYPALKVMESELRKLRDSFEKRFNLIGVPIGLVYDENKRLPASYINFLIVNDMFFLPTYNIREDKKAQEIFSSIFSQKKVVPIDCSLLIKQGGSLHCATMNFFKGTLKSSHIK